MSTVDLYLFCTVLFNNYFTSMLKKETEVTLNRGVNIEVQAILALVLEVGQQSLEVLYPALGHLVAELGQLLGLELDVDHVVWLAARLTSAVGPASSALGTGA